MDGKGCWRDNVFVERLWRSVKYEEVYLRAYDSVPEAKAYVGRYFDFYNGRRPHQSLDGQTPNAIYFNLPQEKNRGMMNARLHLSKRICCPNKRGQLCHPSC